MIGAHPRKDEAIIARESVTGPKSSSPPTAPPSVDSRIIATVETRPAMVHTKVDTSLGFTDESRANAALSAVASIVRRTSCGRESTAAH